MPARVIADVGRLVGPSARRAGNSWSNPDATSISVLFCCDIVRFPELFCRFLTWAAGSICVLFVQHAAKNDRFAL
jgi:hypothetical protein